MRNFIGQSQSFNLHVPPEDAKGEPNEVSLCRMVHESQLADLISMLRSCYLKILTNNYCLINIYGGPLSGKSTLKSLIRELTRTLILGPHIPIEKVRESLMMADAIMPYGETQQEMNDHGFHKTMTDIIRLFSKDGKLVPSLILFTTKKLKSDIPIDPIAPDGRKNLFINLTNRFKCGTYGDFERVLKMLKLEIVSK